MTIVVFFPFAFSSVCGDELRQLQENVHSFEASGVHLVAISTDSMYTLRAYSEAEGITYDLMSDHWPHGHASQAFGVFDYTHGTARRASFLLDADATIVDMIETNRGAARPWSWYEQSLHERRHCPS